MTKEELLQEDILLALEMVEDGIFDSYEEKDSSVDFEDDELDLLIAEY